MNLYQLKTYHEVIDEIYYNVSHLEPWEKGSRKTSGQTGMCGGVSFIYLVLLYTAHNVLNLCYNSSILIDITVSLTMILNLTVC